MRLNRSVPDIRVFMFCIFLLLPGMTAAEEQKVIYTLEKSIGEAMSKSWRLRTKQEKIDQANFLRDQAKTEFLPKLGMSYGYTRQSEERKTSFMGAQVPVSPKDNFQWRGSLTQPVFTGFALTSSYRLAELGIDLSETNLELEKLDLAARVKEAYFNILVADKAVEVAQKEVESLTSNVKVARSFFNVGMIPINDLLKAEVELANAEQNLVKAKNAAMLSRSAFNTILVRPIDEPVALEDILTYRPEKGDYESYLKTAFDARPEIKVLDINILQADQQIRLAKSKRYPEIALTYDYIKEGDTLDVSGSPYHDANRWETMAVLSWTFWEWGKTNYSVSEKESAKKELMQTKSSLEDSIRLEIKDALLALELAEKNIPTTGKAVEQAEENLRVNEERYKAQVTTITEVLDAQALLTRARVTYYSALYDHNLAKARLERAIGAY
ncbi:MAG: TolC family protein [Proteobacteria bacterium]|nr:TolC family protein [Pseudomonadota bacterium]